MKDKEPQFTVYVVTGEAFKFYMEIACAAFHISAPFVNASQLEFTYTDKGGNIIKTHFIWGHHWDLLNKDTEIRFVTLGTGEEHEVLWKQSGLHARYFTIFLLMGHFYLYANSSTELSDPIRTSEQLEELQKELEKYKKEQYRLSPEVAQEIYDNFQSREGIYIDKDTIQKEIEAIYKRLDIDYEVKKKTIEDYYDKPKVSNSKKKPSYKLEVRKM